MVKVMAHMVAFFPDRESSLEVAKGLIDGGCSYLEVQFPFSEPTADGVTIQKACNQALDRGFTVSEGFRLIRRIRQYSDIPVFIMTYGNLVFVRGVERFLEDCREAGASGVIAPDLPPDYDEGLYALGAERGLHIVPVVSINTTRERLEYIARISSGYLYTPLRSGITGKQTDIGGENLEFLSRARSLDVKVLAGFGISEKEQIVHLKPYVHAAVVGTAFVREVMEIDDTSGAGAVSPYDVVKRKMESLLC